MRKIIIVSAVLCLALSSPAQAAAAAGQKAEAAKTQAKQESPAVQAAGAMLDLLAKNLHVKKIVGDPVKVGNVTIIPLIMVDVGYGGGGAGASPKAQFGGGFYMSGEAKPLGFIIVTKSGTKFLSAGKVPRE